MSISSVRPREMLHLFERLMDWGEISPDEARALKFGEYLQTLKMAGLLQNIAGTWLPTHAFYIMLPVCDISDSLQKALFSHPGYRKGMVALVAGEIGRRGREGAQEIVEKWLIQDLSYVAGEINRELDELENNGSLIIKNATPGSIVKACRARLLVLEAETGINYSLWNKDLLDVSGEAEAVFQAAIARGAFAPLPAQKRLLGFEPDLLLEIVDINSELAAPCGRPVFFPVKIGSPEHSSPAWQKRRFLFSSLPLFSENRAVHLPGQEELWSALLAHPVPWILVQLALHAYVAKKGLSSEVKPVRLLPQFSIDQGTDDLIFETQEGRQKYFREELSGLISTLGMRLILPFGQVPAGAVGRLVELLQGVEMLLIGDSGELSLSDQFASELFSKRYIQTIVKTPRSVRNLLVEKINVS